MGRGITDESVTPEATAVDGRAGGGSVLALAAVSMLFRLLMTAAGLKV
jgi:hypothetical protein